MSKTNGGFSRFGTWPTFSDRKREARERHQREIEQRAVRAEMTPADYLWLADRIEEERQRNRLMMAITVVSLLLLSLSLLG